MDALLKFVSQTKRFGHRLFICEPPGPVFLIWADFSAFPRIAGLTVVLKKDWQSNEGIDYKIILNIIRKASAKIPVLEVIYNEDVTEFLIDGQEYNNEEAAKHLADCLKVNLGNNPAKRPNDASQIIDPFHIWSRAVFDGVSVRKLDIDAFILNEDLEQINALIEIKRSAKVGLGKWVPYMSKTNSNSDYWNYILAITFSKIIGATFSTWHHELMTVGEIFTEETGFERFDFPYLRLISEETISGFHSEKNRVYAKGKWFNGDM